MNFIVAHPKFRSARLVSSNYTRRGMVLAAHFCLVGLLAMSGPSAAAEPDPAQVGAPVPPVEEPAGPATLRANRVVMYRMDAETAARAAAAAAYQQQLAQFHAEEGRYREQSAEAARQAEAYKVAQEQYAATLAALKNKDAVVAEPKHGNPKDDAVSCQDVGSTGSILSHRECHTRREWEKM